jgi:hypothetical protein
MNTVPTSMRLARRSAASTSWVQRLAVSPYGLSFISASASSSLATFMMPATGPKLSSIITRME